MKYFAFLFCLMTQIASANIFFPPTGKYSVGTQSVFLKTEKSDHLHRDVVVQFWYPTQITNPSDQKASSTLYDSTDFIHLISTLQKGHLHTLPLNSLKESNTYSTLNATPLSKRNLPVILFSHGLGMDRKSSTSSCEELASHGFVVIGIDHTNYSRSVTFPDGREVQFNAHDFLLDPIISQIDHRKAYIQDIEFVLTNLDPQNKSQIERRFLDLLDLNRIGIFGHSYGGGSAIRVLLQNPSIKAGISLDGLPSPKFLSDSSVKIEKPLMILIGEKLKNKNLKFLVKSENETELSNIEYYIAPAVGEKVQIVAVTNADHQNFTDRALIRKATRSLMPVQSDDYLCYLDEVCQTAPLDEDLAIKTIHSHLLQFFEQNL